MVNVLTRLRVLYEDWSEREKQGKQIKRGLGPVKKRRNRYTRRRNKTQRAQDEWPGLSSRASGR